MMTINLFLTFLAPNLHHVRALSDESRQGLYLALCEKANIVLTYILRLVNKKPIDRLGGRLAHFPMASENQVFAKL